LTKWIFCYIEEKIMTLLRTAWALTTSAAIALMPHMAAQAQTTQGATAPVAPSSAINYTHPILSGTAGERVTPALQQAVSVALERALEAQGITGNDNALVVNHADDVTNYAVAWAQNLLKERVSTPSAAFKGTEAQRAMIVAPLRVFDAYHTYADRQPYSPHIAMVIPSAAQQHFLPILVCGEIPQLKVESPGVLKQVDKRRVFLRGMIDNRGYFHSLPLDGVVEQQKSPNKDTLRPACDPYVMAYHAALKECDERGLGANCPVSRFTEALPQ
jgi:hypothetical protein